MAAPTSGAQRAATCRAASAILRGGALAPPTRPAHFPQRRRDLQGRGGPRRVRPPAGLWPPRTRPRRPGVRLPWLPARPVPASRRWRERGRGRPPRCSRRSSRAKPRRRSRCWTGCRDPRQPREPAAIVPVSHQEEPGGGQLAKQPAEGVEEEGLILLPGQAAHREKEGASGAQAKRRALRPAGILGCQWRERHAGGDHLHGGPQSLRGQIARHRRGGSDDQIRPRGEAHGATDREAGDETAWAGDVVGVSIVPRMVCEEQRLARFSGPASRRRPEEVRVLGVIDIEIPSQDSLPETRPSWERKHVGVVGWSTQPRHADDITAVCPARPVAGSHDRHVVTGAPERAGEGVHRSRQAVYQRPVVIGNQADPHREGPRGPRPLIFG